jgi:hypothetical protein
MNLPPNQQQLTEYDWSKYRIPDEIFLRSLDHLKGETPRELFASADDDFWRLLTLVGGRALALGRRAPPHHAVPRDPDCDDVGTPVDREM